MGNSFLFKDDVVFESENFIIAQDWETPINCFFILSSKRKARSVMDFSESEMTEFTLLLHKARKGMDKVFGIKDVYLFQNEDSKHGFHVWLFPRHKWMERFGYKIQSVRPIMEYAEKNFNSASEIEHVKECARKMRLFFNL